MGKLRYAYIILIGKPDWKRLLRRPRCNWEDNIRMYLIEVGWEVVEWVHLVQYSDKWWAVVNMVMNLHVA
jgi:ribosome biogenesis protein Nip4